MKHLLLLLLFGVSVAFAQQKTTNYMNENLQPISKTEFDQASQFSGEYLKLQFEEDTIITCIRIKRKETGTISKSQVNAIKSGLAQQGDISFKDNAILVINYVPGLNPYDKSEEINYYQSTHFKKYFRSLKKFNNVQQFFVHKLHEDSVQKESDLIWHSDYNRLLEHTFFKAPLYQGSFVIIDAAGHYYCYRGEYANSDIINVLQNKEVFFKAL